MTQIIIDMPNGIANRVFNSFTKRHNYSNKLPNGQDNPETKEQFTKRKIIEFLKESVREAEVQDARNATATQASENVDANINIT